MSRFNCVRFIKVGLDFDWFEVENWDDVENHIKLNYCDTSMNIGKEDDVIIEWERITYLGEKLRNGWINSAKNNKIEISTYGIPALSTFVFNHTDSQKFKTFLTQEYLKKGILASTIFYASTEHNEKIIEEYLDIFDIIMRKIKTCIDGVDRIDKFLEVPVSNSGFSRLN